MKHPIHVLIQLLTSVVIAQKCPLRQQFVGTQRAGRRSQSGSGLQREQGFTQHMRGADYTGTYRTQIHRLILAERGNDRRARHLGGGGPHLTDQHQQKTAVRADDRVLPTQITHRIARDKRSRGGTYLRCAANRKAIEISAPSEHVHQRGDAFIRKICHQAFESEPFDGRIVGVPCQKVENVCLIGVHKRQV